MNLLRCNRGQTIIALLIGAAVLAIVAKMYGLAIAHSRKMTINKRHNVSGEMYASELLDFFRSLRQGRFKAYYASNPFFDTNPALAAYPLCAQINFLDRVTGTILRPDPLADLPATALAPNSDAKLRPNRFYQVQLLNLSNMEMQNQACNLTIDQLAAQNLEPLPTNDFRYSVTVGVSWVYSGESINQTKDLTLSTVLPEF